MKEDAAKLAVQLREKASYLCGIIDALAGSPVVRDECKKCLSEILQHAMIAVLGDGAPKIEDIEDDV